LFESYDKNVSLELIWNSED